MRSGNPRPALRIALRFWPDWCECLLLCASECLPTRILIEPNVTARNTHRFCAPSPHTHTHSHTHRNVAKNGAVPKSVRSAVSVQFCASAFQGGTERLGVRVRSARGDVRACRQRQRVQSATKCSVFRKSARSASPRSARPSASHRPAVPPRMNANIYAITIPINHKHR